MVGELPDYFLKPGMLMRIFLARPISLPQTFLLRECDVFLTEIMSVLYKVDTPTYLTNPRNLEAIISMCKSVASNCTPQPDINEHLQDGRCGC